MKKEAILAHLREAKQELDETIAEIEQDNDFDLDGYCDEQRIRFLVG